MKFAVLLAAVLLPMHASTYNILLVPIFGKSHIFSLAAIAESLADRGHRVTFLVGQNFPLVLPELSNRTEVSVARYKDTTGDGEDHVDYGALERYIIESAIESGGAVKSLVPLLKKLYVQVSYLSACYSAEQYSCRTRTSIHCCQKLESLCNIFVADSRPVGLVSFTLTW